jgi:hypothetical protein
MPWLFDKLGRRCNTSAPFVVIPVEQQVATGIRVSIGPTNGSPLTPLRGVLEA